LPEEWALVKSGASRPEYPRRSGCVPNPNLPK
jgi:hypothetical protein